MSAATQIPSPQPTPMIAGAVPPARTKSWTPMVVADCPTRSAAASQDEISDVMVHRPGRDGHESQHAGIGGIRTEQTKSGQSEDGHRGQQCDGVRKTRRARSGRVRQQPT